MLATVDQLKTYLNIGPADLTQDGRLDMLLRQVSARLAVEAGRTDGHVPCLESKDRVKYGTFWTDQTALWLPAFPVSEIISVREADREQFDSAPELLAGQDYQLDPGLGVLYRANMFWRRGTRAVRVVYVGGYAPAGVEIAGVEPLPDDINQAAILQAAYWFQRRHQGLGVESSSTAGGSFSMATVDGLLPEVVQTMARYRRMYL